MENSVFPKHRCATVFGNLRFIAEFKLISICLKGIVQMEVMKIQDIVVRFDIYFPFHPHN